jgi:hypothetical protein
MKQEVNEMPELKEEKVVEAETTTVKEPEPTPEVVVIEPNTKTQFEKHVYDCPTCGKKVKVHLGECGCPNYSGNIYSWTMKHLP